MLTQVDVTRFASYQWGMRAGIEKGKLEGKQEGKQEATLQLITLLLSQRFGTLPDTVAQRLSQLTVGQLQALTGNVLALADVAALDTWLLEIEGGKRLN